MGLVAIAGAVALVLGAGGESRLIPTEDHLNLGRMKDVCVVAAAQEFDTTQGLIVFADDVQAIRQADGSYRLEGVAEAREIAFQCVFNDRGHFNSVKPLASPGA